MKQAKSKSQDPAPMPPGNEAILNVTCKDVVLGRGNGTQNHCGNVTYRKLVYLNKELYATSSKFEKLKISKALVAAIRKFGGRFLQGEGDKQGHFEIGDKRAWDKTSQALREGQTQVRARLEQEAKNATDGASKVAEYKKVISDQAFLAYACKILQSLYDPNTGSSTSCGPNCPHAKRRVILHRGDALSAPDAIPYHHGNHYGASQIHDNRPYIPQGRHHYMPPPQSNGSFYYSSMEKGNANINYDPAVPETYSMPMRPIGNAYADPLSSLTPSGIHGENLDSLEPLPYNLHYHQPQDTYQHPSHVAARPHQEEFSALPSTTWEPAESSRKEHLNNQDSFRSYDTEALRKLLSEDADIESDQVGRQVEEMIRRKSHGLIRIDMVDAFEDLVFEEDSTGRAKFPEPQVGNASDRHMSGLTDRGESLMNMSLLTIEDSRDGGPVLRSIDEKSPSEHKYPNRVGFAVENVSAMSMDLGSSSDIVNDPSSKEPHLSMSRKMGFPIRPSVLKSYQAGASSVIPKKFDEASTREIVPTLTLSEASALRDDVTEKVPKSGEHDDIPAREKKISTLTLPAVSAFKTDLDFSELARNVADSLDISQTEIDEKSPYVDRSSHVGFAAENFSAMSLDVGSFRDILCDLTVNESSEEGKSNTSTFK
eukprot:CCRYP_018285-RA/>CCRYP_018285-RA protein AED:0.00 eAED:0.00 QI:215/1/1/1/1/1/2/273/653